MRAATLLAVLLAAGAPAAAAERTARPAEAVSPLLGTVPEPAPSARSADVADVPDAARLQMPIDGLRAEDLRDSYDESRSEGRRHEALDIPAAEGTPVRAVVSGRVAKLFVSVPGGLTLYQFDGAERFSYYYAHLSAYAEGLEEGQWLRQGQILGYVGHSGNASAQAPHLHFEIKRLNPDKLWWQGTPLNPFPYLVAGEAPQPLSADGDS